MPLTFTLNHNTSYQGLSSLFPLRSVPSSLLSYQVEAPLAIVSTFYPCHLHVVSSYYTCLYHERTFIPKPKPPVTVCHIENIWLVSFFEDLRKRKAPNNYKPKTSQISPSSSLGYGVQRCYSEGWSKMCLGNSFNQVFVARGQSVFYFGQQLGVWFVTRNLSM
jgi:hypothetical protein